MKTKVLIYFAFSLFMCQSPPGGIEIEIPIQVYGKSITPLVPNETLHKDKDVEILRIPFLEFDKSINTLNTNRTLQKDKDEEIKILISDSENENIIFYSCIIYRIDKGILKGYQTHMSFLNNYDKASYQWVNDSTLTVKFNNKFHISKEYTVMGYGNTTLLHWDD
jgi:hypothetical protein